MAKKIQSLSSNNVSPLDADARQSYSGSFVGDFTGDLTGNADTATSLAAPFTVTLSGNAQGSFTTAGGNAMLNVKVLQSDQARFAETAQTAQRADVAASAQTAATANSATTAINAGNAATANVANHAETATLADRAREADSAKYAPHADEADHAHTADEAKTAAEADHAKKADVATALANPDTPVQEAEHAKKADVATVAQYDCLGRSITHTYATKDEIPTDYLTEKQANNLYVPRREQVTQAIVKGKAFGHGFLCGNSLMIMIDDLACNDAGLNVYGDIEFVDQFVEETANTTKVYIDSRGRMFVYAAVVDDFGAPGLGHWVEITSGISEDVQGILDKLKDVVTVTGTQTITGPKEFTAIIHAGIPSEEDDDEHSVVTLHNLRDLREEIEGLDREPCLEILPAKPSTTAGLKPLKLYAYPLTHDPNEVIKVSIYDHPVTVDDIIDGEAAFFGINNLLD